jgi:cytochrome c oxidase subunit 3
VFVAGVNTLILLSSSATVTGRRHRSSATTSAACRQGCCHLPARSDLPDHAGDRVPPHRLQHERHVVRATFFGLTGLHGAHVFIGLTILLIMTVRSFRGHFSPEHHHGLEVGGIYWHFVDVMWIVVYVTVYLL